VIVFESKKSRRILVRLERGEELVAAIESLAERERIGAAWIRGIGTLEWVELDRHDQARRKAEPPQRFDLPCDVLSLEGNVSTLNEQPRAVLHAAIARRTDNGLDVIGGRVRRGGVFHIELAIEAFDDVSLARERDEATGLALWAEQGEQSSRALVREREPEPEEAEESPSDLVSWADVARASTQPVVPERSHKRKPSEPPNAPFKPPPIPDRRRSTEDEFLSQVLPERGDFIEHRQFGLCKVDREDEEGGLIIRLPSGIRKTIKLDFMDVGEPRTEGTRRIFPVRPRMR
jgi:predicted DNA-binding protein with PD1-like motif